MASTVLPRDVLIHSDFQGFDPKAIPSASKLAFNSLVFQEYEQSLVYVVVVVVVC